LAEKAKEEQFKAMRDAIKELDSRLQPELREEIVRMCFSGLQYTNLGVLITFSDDLESQSIPVRSVAFQQIRSTIKVSGRPIWPRAAHSRAYHLEMDLIYNQYKYEITNPWIRSHKQEGEKSLIVTSRAG
jgi:hypothetical protein